ncbi:unannotated protein [freshwater metagenome]|uniref:Unannotated protein n=1 Tax=freshwater metagenome TaxID=449393 RepID=A0A6J7CWU8_9ZZZZ|nr:hypothetical protein [Actinomycetota bacterium]
MKRIAISFALIVSLVIPTALPVNASEKCLANFADSEWTNGTPAAVTSLLGFDLVEKKTQSIPDYINSYYLFGEHTEVTTYNYVGRNCSSRDVKVSKVINEQSIIFKHQSINEFITKYAKNFLTQENSVKYYAEIREIFAQKSIEVVKQTQVQRDFRVVSEPVRKILDEAAKKYERNVVVPLSTFIYFPSKCIYFNDTVYNSEIRDKVFAIGLRAKIFKGSVAFASTGDCIGELRQGGSDGLFEKIADVKYVVSSAPTATKIICKKGKTLKTIQGTNSKCPTGYKKA